MGFWEGAGKNHQIDIEILQSIKVNSIKPNNNGILFR